MHLLDPSGYVQGPADLNALVSILQSLAGLFAPILSLHPRSPKCPENKFDKLTGGEREVTFGVETDTRRPSNTGSLCDLVEF